MTEHAAAQAPMPIEDAPPAAPLGTALPAAAAFPCMRRLEPDFTKPCPNQAAGGLKITLKPSPTITKRWGLHSMLTFILDLTVCEACFPKVNILEVTDPHFRSRLGKAAQQMNNGVLVDWSQTVIEPVAFEDPQHVVLRREMAARAEANNGSPA